MACIFGRRRQNKPVEDSYKHKGMRKRLIDSLREKGISDEKVLEAMLRVPRHFFLDNAFATHAYEDKAFPIGEGQTISQPYTVAFQSELLAVKPGMQVLEVGTGSGYQCAVLLELGCEVYSIEYNEYLFQKASYMLKYMGYKPKLKCGDGSLGWKAHAPYDRIIVTAGAPGMPETFVEQLKPGGRLVTPVGDRQVQRMMLVTKDAYGEIATRDTGGFSFVPLRGLHGWK